MISFKKVNSIVFLSVLLGIFTLFSVAGFAAEQLTVKHELGETTVTKNPERVVVFDFGVLDSMLALDIDVIALAKSGTVPSYLSHYNDAKYANIGSLKEPDLERIYGLKPDLIIISGRQSTFYDELTEIAPTIYMGTDTSRYMESFKENARLLGHIFGKEDEVESELAKVDAAVDELRKEVTADNKNALITLVNDTSISAYGAGSRFGIIHDVFGFIPVDNSIVVTTHGQTISSEFILTKDPEYLFVVDRTQVVGDGPSSAKTVIENQLVRHTKAYKNGNIVYLNPEYWYLSGGGLLSVPAMINEVASGIK